MCGQLTKIPDNTAGLVGSSITLQCAGTVLQWEAFATSPQEAKTISVEARNYKSNMYDLITMPAGTYNLTIKSLVLANGGGFQCKAINDVHSFAIAQVIVFKGKTGSFYNYCLLYSDLKSLLGSVYHIKCTCVIHI